MSEWGIKPWNFDKLSARDVQEIRLAEHAETYMNQEQRERARGRQQGSVSTGEYNASKSRRNAFND